MASLSIILSYLWFQGFQGYSFWSRISEKRRTLSSYYGTQI